MGRIAHIELYNFKSYKGTHLIGPFKPFTAIIGPNGAGKSNLMDAISFVLGVRTGHLRGTNLRDLITRDADSNRAYVKLIFVADDEEETEFTRNIIGQTGASEYRVNNRVATWDAYNRKLRDFDIYVKARNFLVFQGDVESLASKSPKELTAMIEQISGSEEHKDDYNAKLTAKEKAEENTIFTFQKKKGINKERRDYKEQKEEAERFQKLLEQRNKMQLDHILFQLFHIDKDLSQCLTDVDQQHKIIAQLEAKEASIQAKLKERKKEQAKTHKENLRIERKMRNLKQVIEDERPVAIRLREEISHVSNRLKNSRSTLMKLQEEYNQHVQLKKSLSRALQKVIEEEKEFAEEQQQQEAQDITFLGDQLKEYHRLKEEARQKTFSFQQELEQVKRQQKLDGEAVDGYEAKLKELNDRKEQNKKEEAKLTERKKKIEEYLTSTMQKINELKDQLTELTKSNQKAQRRQAELNRALEETQENLRDAKAERRESERDIQFNETLESLKRLFPGVHGRVLDICKPTQKKYNVAVTVTMGRHMDSIVVDDTKTAMDCIAYMYEQRAGTATFIPLEGIQVKSTQEKLRQLPGSAKLVIDIIQFESTYLKALQYACGNTLVCDTVDEAKRLAFRGKERNKVVAVDGTLIRKSGLITGGLSGIESRAQRWTDKTVRDLKKRRDKYLKELAELGETLRSVTKEQQLRSQIAGLESRYTFAKADLELTEEKIEKNQEENRQITEEIRKIPPELRKLREALESRKERITQLSRQINTVEDKIFSDFSAAVGVSNIREYEEDRHKRATEATKRQLELSNQKSLLQNQLEYENHRNLEAPLKRLEETITTDQELLEELEQKENETDQLHNSQIEEMAKLKSDFKETRTACEEKETEIQEIKKELSVSMHKIGSVQKQLTATETQVDQLRGRRRNLLQRCKVEEIRLPRSNQDKPSDDSATPMEIDEHEDAVVPDYSSLPKKMREVKSTQQYETINNKFLDEIQAMTSNVEKLAPNLKAIDRFDDVMERFKTTNTEFESARQTAKEAADQFAAVKAARYDRFMAAFNVISQNIDKIYKELTKGVPAGNPGGTAYLSLDNPEEPFLHGIKYNAMPPRKRFRDMEQLSGGEKTVAALALLFAIHSFRPSPFFVLDEIDAALDNVNVNKVARYIKERSASFQCLVISLKDIFYEKADALVGVVRDEHLRSSRTLTLDLIDRCGPP